MPIDPRERRKPGAVKEGRRIPGLGPVNRFEARLPKLTVGADASSHQAAMLAAITELHKVIGDQAALLDRLVPKVLQTETIVLDANGTATRVYRVPFQSLGVDYFGTTTLTVTAAPLAAQAPGPGQGVGKVGPGGFAVLNFKAYAASFYGNPGDVLTVTAYGRPQEANGVVNSAAGVLVAAPAGGLLTVPASDYPQGAIPVAASATGAASAIAATLPAIAGRTTWLTGFEVTGAGATAASVVVVTAGPVTAGSVTLSYELAVPAGVTAPLPALSVELPKPLPAPAANTAIPVNVPSLGAGNTNAAVVAHGYQL